MIVTGMRVNVGVPFGFRVCSDAMGTATRPIKRLKWLWLRGKLPRRFTCYIYMKSGFFAQKCHVIYSVAYPPNRLLKYIFTLFRFKLFLQNLSFKYQNSLEIWRIFAVLN